MTTMEDARGLAVRAVAHLDGQNRGYALDLIAKVLPPMVQMRRGEPVKERDKTAVRDHVSTLRNRWQVTVEAIDQLVACATRLLDPQLTQLVADIRDGLPAPDTRQSSTAQP